MSDSLRFYERMVEETDSINQDDSINTHRTTQTDSNTEPKEMK